MIKVYTASWCNPCQQLKKVLDQEDIEYILVDIDIDPEQARVDSVRGIPTLVCEDTGRRLVGAITAKQLRDFMSH